MVKRQNSFEGGIDQISPTTDIPDNAVELLINGRSRHGEIEPIAKHVELSNAPAGIKQGLISVGNYLLLFVAGKVYVNIDGETTWTNIPGFNMSHTAYRYWIQAVPSSSVNFLRKADGANSTGVIKASTLINGTPQCIVVQDGVNQPWLVFYDSIAQVFSSRAARTWNEWQNPPNTMSKEYVPIGREMMLLENILHIVAPDRKSVYRSITGRPLDFMINVDNLGNKAATEALGGAATVSYSFDSEDITCLKTVNIPSSFVYATANTVRILTYNYDLGIFDEPAFTSSYPLDAGIVNQDSFLEIIGDFAFIDSEAVKSFNAVQTLKIEGSTDIFSMYLTRMLKGVKQQNCSVTKIDNYALFNLDTIYGNIFVIYDMLRNKWCSVDITPALKIKQFATVKTASEFKLYAISFDDRVYHLYGSTTETFPVTVFTKTYQPDNPKSEHKSEWLKPALYGGTEDGEVTLTEYVDGRKSANHIRKELTNSVGPILFPVRPPVMQDVTSGVDFPGFQLKDGLKGLQIRYCLQWDTDHILGQFEVQTREDMSITSQKQKNNT